MSLTFEHESIAYERAVGLMRFFASDGAVLNRCGVSIAALAELEDYALADPEAMVITYHRNRELIQEIVERKYRARQFESSFTVIVRREGCRRVASLIIDAQEKAPLGLGVGRG